MTAENLANFMSREQKVEMAVEECEKLIEAFEPTGERTALSMEGTSAFSPQGIIHKCYSPVTCK